MCVPTSPHIACPRLLTSPTSPQIFFPRNVENEVQSRHATREKSRSRHAGHEYSRFSEDVAAQKRLSSALSGTSPLREYPPALDEEFPPPAAGALAKSAPLGSESEAPSPVFMPNRRVASGIVVAGRVIEPTPARLTERALAAHDENMSGVHPFLHNFTSPIGAYLSLGVSCVGVT